MAVAFTWGNERNALSEAISGSRHYAFLTIPSLPLAPRTRDGAACLATMPSKATIR